MIFFLPGAGKLKRKTSFPIKVSRIYSCDWKNFPTLTQVHDQYFSVVLRYDSDSKLCKDVINGQVMGTPFPNVVFKIPGMKIQIVEDSPRSAIGFGYTADIIEILYTWGMFPKEPFLALSASTELKRLIDDFNKFSRIYPTLSNPGDRIDRICFSILQEIMISQTDDQIRKRPPEIRIEEVELYFQNHYDEKINLETVAEMFGFTHTSFYQYWKKTYQTTPHQYIERLRLRSAALKLIQSSRALSEISDELQFPGTSYFHKKFREHFHTTPAEFRKNRQYWKAVLCNKSEEN